MLYSKRKTTPQTRTEIAMTPIVGSGYAYSGNSAPGYAAAYGKTKPAMSETLGHSENEYDFTKFDAPRAAATAADVSDRQ